MRCSSSSLVALAFVAVSSAQLSAQSLSAYDVFVFQNFAHTNSETNGRIAIGGNADMTHWGVGQFLPHDYSDFSLVVGGNLTSFEGGVFNGRTYVGGTLTAVNTGFPAAHPPEGGTPPVDFSSEIVRLTGISNAYAAMADNGSTRWYNGELEFLGGAGTNVYTVTIEDLQASTAGYAFINPSGAVNIVNVIGSSATSAFNNNGYFFDCLAADDRSTCQSGTNFATPMGAYLTTWNFNQQETIEVGGPVHGNILAPNASVNFGQGDVVGDVVVRNATSAAEYYSLDAQTFPTPEPATLGLVAIGIATVAGAVRLRRRNTAR